LRFKLRHLFAITTLFATLIAIGTVSDAINRDDIWTVESVATEHWGGSWHGENPATGEPCGGAILMYVAKLRDGDRTRFACFGDDIDDLADPNRPDLPKIGDSFVFTGAEMPVGKPLFPGASISVGPPPGSPSYFAVDDHTVVLPAQPTDGYSRIFNVIVAFILAVLPVTLFALFHRLIVWLQTMMTEWQKRREHFRRTHIV